MPEIIEITNAEAKVHLEEMRRLLSARFGVTLIGNRLTLRWGQGDNLIQISAIITEVETASEHEEAMEEYEKHRERLAYLNREMKRKKPHVDLEAAMWYLEHGEWPQ